MFLALVGGDDDFGRAVGPVKSLSEPFSPASPVLASMALVVWMAIVPSAASAAAPNRA